MKATELLKDQHQEIDELFERITLAEGDEVRSIRDDLASILFAHSVIEKEMFYPAGREAIGAAFQIHTSLEEHAIIYYALQRLVRSDLGDERFHARVGVLKDLVQRHVEDEEDNLLKQAENAMAEEQLEELGERMDVRFGEVRSGDVEVMLTEELAESIPSPRRAPAKRAAVKRAPAKRAAVKRAPAKRAAVKRAPSKRAPAKRAQAARPEKRPAKGAKQAPSASQTKQARPTSTRKGTRPAKGTRGTTARKASRSGSAAR